MTSNKPKWRQVFDKVERAVGVPLEDVAASNRFVEVVAVGIKVRRAAFAGVSRVVHGVTRPVLHAANIATRDDVRRVTTSLSTLAGEVRARELAQRPAATTAAPVRKAADRSTGAEKVTTTPNGRRSAGRRPASPSADG
ncbi:MAG: hypothetical protein NVSMB4_06800 [Acidimicrobiales bacterium]